jgi:two-component system chemotaxis response regulator CheB
MDKIRVLIVDDAVLARKVIADSISCDPVIEIVGFASNGRLALQRLAAAHPDLVILDLEMPEMNGLETIDAMRAQYPHLPIVMCSAYTDQGAEQTLEALSRGANDYVTKPSKSRDLEESRTKLREELLPKIKALCTAANGAPTPSASPRPRGTGGLPSVAVDVLAIGSSTGGPSALAAVLPLLNADFPVPILITQHMPKLFTALLAERLAAQSKIKVVEGSAGLEPQPGCAYIAPGGYHMVVRRDGERVVLDLTEDAAENSCRPSVDVMLRSVVEVYGEHVLSLILTGMGQDGLRGCEAVRRRGGIVIAQDEASSVVWGMPGAISEAGVAHAISPLSDIAPQIERIVVANRILRRGSRASEEQ